MGGGGGQGRPPLKGLKIKKISENMKSFHAYELFKQGNTCSEPGGTPYKYDGYVRPH